MTSWQKTASKGAQHSINIVRWTLTCVPLRFAYKMNSAFIRIDKTGLPQNWSLSMFKQKCCSRLPYTRSCVQDELLPDLLVFPPQTDLHSHPLVESGSLILQVHFHYLYYHEPSCSSHLFSSFGNPNRLPYRSSCLASVWCKTESCTDCIAFKFHTRYSLMSLPGCLLPCEVLTTSHKSAD